MASTSGKHRRRDAGDLETRVRDRHVVGRIVRIVLGVGAFPPERAPCVECC